MTTGAPPSTPPTRPRRSRRRTFAPLGVALWLVLEIWLLVLVAEATSGFVVFLLLVAGVVLGSLVVKRAGRRALSNLSQTLGTRSPGQRTQKSGGSGNGLTMLAGLLLVIPGLISDAAGLVLLVPPIQKAVRRLTERTIDRRLGAAAPGSLGDAFQQARMHRPDGKVVQGEVVRDTPADAPPPPRPPLTH
ncbi:FxsA family membrane protein [Streptomyces sp. NPDC048664]|uniref:FxsA family membrane protein n=1 Tax=Streptomyces sp. NPDC048664 TaxID=3154505 RepID=UPI0034248925